MRFGVLGTGGIAAKVLTVGIRRAGHTVVAVGSRTQASADAFAAKWNIPAAFGSYEALIQDPEVEAVYIALPSGLHKEWTLNAAKAKKHVLCEKPVAPYASDVIEMIDACAAAGVVFLDGTFFKHHPRNAEIRDLIVSGALGDVTSVFSQFCSDARGMPADAIRHQPAMERTGVLGDMGWYTVRFGLHVYGYELPERVRVILWIYMLLIDTGKKKVTGTIVQRHPETGAAIHFIGQLLFANVIYVFANMFSHRSYPTEQNRIAQFDCSFVQMISQYSHINGTKGVLALDDTFVPYGGMIDMKNPDAFAPAGHDEYRISRAGGQWETRRVSIEREGEAVVEETRMIEDFVACAHGDGDWRAWGAQSVAIHRVLDALWESAEAGGVPVRIVV
ncbi:hypothetical protein HDU82_009201 [Entophlyctis luteolus]|nr:hypothetical protein HDU82_009201 [Entophlyctis luteolus]